MIGSDRNKNNNPIKISSNLLRLYSVGCLLRSALRNVVFVAAVDNLQLQGRTSQNLRNCAPLICLRTSALYVSKIELMSRQIIVEIR